MRTARRIATLTRLTPAMAIAAPLIVFGFLYVFQVQPERTAAAKAREQLAAAQALADRDPMFVAPVGVVNEASALEQVNAGTVEGDPHEVAGALTRLLSGPEVGGVSNVSIEIGAPSSVPIESIAGMFSPKVMHTRVTMTFDARYEQIRRFFWNLRVLPATVELQSLELTPALEPGAALMHATASLLVFHRHESEPSRRPARPQVVADMVARESGRDQVATAPRRDAAPVSAPAAAGQRDPVVSSILISGARRVALVDGQVVGPGDRVRGDVVQSIESDSVIVASARRARRLAIGRPVIGMTRR